MMQSTNAICFPPVLHATILPWFAWLFTVIAAAAVFSESRVDSVPDSGATPINDKTSARERTPSIN